MVYWKLAGNNLGNTYLGPILGDIYLGNSGVPIPTLMESRSYSGRCSPAFAAAALSFGCMVRGGCLPCSAWVCGSRPKRSSVPQPSTIPVICAGSNRVWDPSGRSGQAVGGGEPVLSVVRTMVGSSRLRLPRLMRLVGVFVVGGGYWGFRGGSDNSEFARYRD